VVPDVGPLPVAKLKGGLEITLLSPTPRGLANLVPRWEEDCKRAGLVEGVGAEIPRSWQRDEILGFEPESLAKQKYKKDSEPPNGSSIAFIATYNKRSVLCGADAHAEVLVQSLERLGRPPHRFSAVKLPHHGSTHNLSPVLVERLRSSRWLVSTNGARFHHPNPECLARVIMSQTKPKFTFNYVTDEIKDVLSSAGTNYTVRIPKPELASYGQGIVTVIER